MSEEELMDKMDRIKEHAKAPNPGTREAQLLGCICPVMDNHYGDGVPDGKGGRMFWYNGGCPLHDNKAKENNNGGE